MNKSQVIIVGAGLAGLCCARALDQAGLSSLILERSDAVGGRVRTDRFEGFLLDRGFQVLLTAYPECGRVLDYDALDLKCFLAGSVIRQGGRSHRLADPWRQPSSAIASLLSPIGSFSDKLRVARLRWSLRGRDIDALFEAPESTTIDRLRELGFSERMIEGFFRPFLGGVFLDKKLETSSRMFEFVFKMFSEGDVVVPGKGMQAIPESIAAELPTDTICLNAEVEQVSATGCTLAGGERIEADRVVIATDGSAASRLWPASQPPAWRTTACLYFDAAEPPFEEPLLMLDGDGRGPANNVCVLSRIAPDYAPAGRSLISVSAIDGDYAETDMPDLDRAVRVQLRDWFGAAVDDWRSLRQYRIARALPAISPSNRGGVRELDGLLLCGDHLLSPSIQGAMLSGRQAAEFIVK